MKNLKKMGENDEMRSLNEQLYDDFFIQELETRLETDTLMVGGLTDTLRFGGLVDSTEVDSWDCFRICNCFGFYNVCGEQSPDFTTFWPRFFKFLCNGYM
jgi:hypothetical protein